MAARKKVDPATDARKHAAPLLKDWALQWKPALVPVAGLIERIEKRKSPRFDTLLAKGLREFFCHRDTDASLQEFGRVLGVFRKQGKRSPTAGETEHIERARFEIAAREIELTAMGISPRRARSRAVREYASSDHVPLRTVQTWYRNPDVALQVVRFHFRATKSRDNAARFFLSNLG
jgi:hypothetical protein